MLPRPSSKSRRPNARNARYSAKSARARRTASTITAKVAGATASAAAATATPSDDNPTSSDMSNDGDRQLRIAMEVATCARPSATKVAKPQSRVAQNVHTRPPGGLAGAEADWLFIAELAARFGRATKCF